MQRRLALVSVTLGLLGLTGCVVMPGRTAGETWGGSYAARGTPPTAEKAEEKKSEAKAPPMDVPAGPHDRPAYVTRLEKGRLWVFKAYSKDLADYLKKGEPGKSVTVLGAGPDGMTLRAPDIETVRGWQHSKAGFETFYRDERFWVFREGSLFASEMRYFGEPTKIVTLVGRGPGGSSLRSSDTETGEAWVAAPYLQAPPP